MSEASNDLERPRYAARRARVGEWEITELCDGSMRLDGGSMWGVVPRTLWCKLTPPSVDHTIELALRPFLARRGREVVVIEGGIGARWEAKWREIYAMRRAITLVDSLAACGVAPHEVTHVVASHCHWDHIGALVIEQHGGLAPQFPRARHFAPAIEIEMAKKPGHARQASYRAEDVELLERSRLLEPFSGECELLDGLVAHELGGHSDGVSVITLESREERAIFWGDVVPTTHHIQPSYIMAYDLDVARSFEVRSRWLERAASENLLGLFYHDAEHAFGRLTREGKRYVCRAE